MDIKVDVAEGIAVVTIDRPEVRNALRLQTIEELRAAMTDLRGKAKVLIFTGAGDQSFVAGRDINDLPKLTRRDALEHRLSGLFRDIETFEAPSIAAVNGYALGGGFEFALACDLRIASEKAMFGLPETRLNIIPAAGGTQRLPRIAGMGVAKDMILTGRIIDAKRAYELGIVSEVVAPDKLIEAARATAAKIVERGPLATTLAKAVLNQALTGTLETTLTFEKMAQAILFESKDKLEGVSAFLEKRKPRFRGE